MDLGKFLSLVDRSTLYFASAKTLLLGDPYEGAVGEVTKRHLGVMLEELGVDDPNFWHDHKAVMAAKRRTTYISCWHLSEHESAAMWAIYTQRGYGLAVRSTYSRLIESVTDETPFFVGRVEYRDYSTAAMRDDGGWFWPFLYKRHYFDYEREVRAITADIGGAGTDAGRELKVDLSRLIERIYVSPTEPAWYGDLIRSLVERRFGLPPNLVHVSDLRSDPFP